MTIAKTKSQPQALPASGIRDNHRRGSVGSFLQGKIQSASRLSIVSAYFTIYAFEALKAQLTVIEDLQFLFGEPRFVRSLDPNKTDKKSFQIEDNGLRLQDRLEQRRVAKDCADWIQAKVQIRSVKQANLLHGKMYHIANNGVEDAIMGSSNFTVRGLGLGESGNNIELNLEVDSNRDRRDLKAWFDELWQDESLVEDVKDDVLQYLEQLYQNHAPQFIYYKTLFHIFERFLADQDASGLLAEKSQLVDTAIWNTLFEFQKDGVKGAINKIRAHNGCIIADSVGLGKTFEALAVIKYFELLNHRVLVLCPKKLRENWTVYQAQNNSELNPFVKDRFSYTVLSHTDLSRESGFSGDINLEAINWGNYDLIVIDESHNFRNNTSSRRDEEGTIIRKSRYERLLDDVIKQGIKTKVLLLSATPVNNDLKDLRNQLYFLTEGRDDAFRESVGIASLKETLASAQRTFTTWAKQHQDRKTSDLLEKLSSSFFKLLDELTIARSRQHIQRYYKATIAALGGFPERLKPVSVYPTIDLKGRFPSYDKINDEISEYQLSLFNPAKYVLPQYQHLYDKGKSVFSQGDREHFLIGMMKVNFLKRLESSVSAFAITMDNTIQKIEDLQTRLQQFKVVQASSLKKRATQASSLKKQAAQASNLGDIPKESNHNNWAIFESMVFFSPDREIEITQRNLPHWQQEGVTYFVTFRLADSLPYERLEALQQERKDWLKQHQEPKSESSRAEYHQLFSQRIQDWLDAGEGSCCLRDPAIAQIVADALNHFEGDRYRLGDWVIMPNHVHVLVTPLGEHTLTDILHSWKSFTSNKINKSLKRKGQVWQHESYDHIVRSPEQLIRIQHYIADNPRKAGITITHASNTTTNVATNVAQASSLDTNVAQIGSLDSISSDETSSLDSISDGASSLNKRPKQDAWATIVQPEMESLDDDELQDAMQVGQKLVYQMAHLDVEAWLKDLDRDKDQLVGLYNSAEAITVDRDAKLAELKQLIWQKVQQPTTNKRSQPNRKVIVFTAFADTATYLYQSLKEWAKTELAIDLALVTGDTSRNKTTFGKTEFNQILTNFSPISKKRSYMASMPQTGEIDLLIATDCISEGQNLQDCDYLVNYDIHWNPVRLIQRFGRIDRIGSINTSVQMVNFWPTDDLNKYINLKNRVEARMALVDITATQDDNLLANGSDMIEDELKYRDKQLLRLRDEVLDLEDFTESISLTDFTLDDFRIELSKYIESNRKLLADAPLGLYALVPTHPDYATIAPGVIFCLRQKTAAHHDTVNPLQPYFLVYVRDDRLVRYSFAQPKQILEIYRLLCADRTAPYEELCHLFDQETNNGADMSPYNELIQAAVNSIARTFNRQSLSQLQISRSATLPDHTQQVTDTTEFDLITWLVIHNGTNRSPQEG